MNVEIFSLCDAATQHAGKLNILGAFDTIWGINEPIKFAGCCVAARVRFDSIESGTHKIRLDFIDADGKPVLPKIEGDISVNSQDSGKSAISNFVMNIHNLELEKFGDYQIRLAINGRTESTVPLYVVKKTQNKS